MKKNFGRLYDGTLFCYAYLALTLLSFNPYIYYRSFMRALVAAAAVLGAAALAYKLIYFRRYSNAPCFLVAAAFLLSNGITALVNAHYGLSESVQGFLWLAFQLLILLPRDVTEPKENMLRQLCGLGGFYLAYNALAALIGIVMAFLGIGEAYHLNPGAIVPRGFVWGRLWGMYTDPNYGAASVCVSFALCLLFLMRARKKLMRVLLYLCMALFYLYIVFSDSRTGIVALASLAAVYAFCRLYARGRWGKKTFAAGKRILFACVLAILISGVAAFGVQGTKKAYNSLVARIYVSQENGGKEEEPRIDREYDDASDVSNGRLSLWKSGVELFQKAPVFGVGFRNFQAAARVLAPDTYLIQNPQKFLYDAYHNMLVDVTAAQGVVGILAFLALLICAAVHLIRALPRMLKTDSRVNRFAAALLSAIAAVLAESLFISDLFYVNTPTSFMFWLLLGMLLRLSEDIKNADAAQLDEWERVLRLPIRSRGGGDSV
ncbi:MAG TPA: O-antigen ligase family protein [Clostridia bacterium]|nr:O-antigen ligase family protein [Clostridia bacterium]